MWDVVPEWRAGRQPPLREIPVARVVEIELHRVDLDAGYSPADWPAASTDLMLGAALARLTGAPGAPPLRVHVDGDDAEPAASTPRTR